VTASVWRLRLATLACVAALVLAIRALAPDPGMRRATLLLAALGTGYGHQLGAFAFARRRARSALDRLMLATTALSLGLAFALALASPAAPWLLIALAGLAAWHVIENDVALAHAEPGRTRLPSLSRKVWPHLTALAAAAAVVATALAAPGLAPTLVARGVPVWLAAWTPEEVIAVLLLHHSAVWAVKGWQASSPAGAPIPPGHRASILLLHALPLVALAGARELAPAAFAWALSPPIYLFLSTAHAIHTCVERGFEPA
jgi:hypothetical protein